jgi:hypothetical protein
MVRIIESGWGDWLALGLVFLVIYLLGGLERRQAARLQDRITKFWARKKSK